jgi:uncharacterized protein involved in exopolysaccharide biosynthesis
VEPKPFSILGIINAFLRHSRLLAAGVIVGCIIGAVSIVIVPRRQIAESTFVVEGDASSSRTSAVAAQFGITLGSAAPSAPGAPFYEELLTSRAILSAAVQKKYDTPAGPRDLMEYYKVEGSTPEQKLNAAVRALRLDLNVTPDLNTNMVTLRVTAKSGIVATQINANLLDLIGQFNVLKRRTQAAQERDFLQGRSDEAKRELRAAESKLEQFLQANRTYQTSPQLAFQAQRLQQDIDLKRDISTSVTQSFERARIDAVRTTPSFTVIDSPAGSAVRDGHGPLIRAIIGAIVGFLIAGAWALVREVASQSRQAYPQEYREFSELRRAILRFPARKAQ